MADGEHDRPAVALVDEANLPQQRQYEAVVALPGPAAVAGRQQHAGAAGPKGIDPAADGPAGLRTDEGHRVQRAGHARLLQVPMPAGIVGVPNHAAVADGPALTVADEGQIVQLGIGAVGLGRHEDLRRRCIAVQGGGWPVGGPWAAGRPRCQAGAVGSKTRRSNIRAAPRGERAVRHLDPVGPERNRTLVSANGAGQAGVWAGWRLAGGRGRGQHQHERRKPPAESGSKNGG